LTAAARTARKWRPSLGLLVAAVLAIVLALPLLGLLFFQLYGNQLVHKTEESLIGQARVLAATMAMILPEDAPLGLPAPELPGEDGLTPVLPVLDLSRDTILPRPENPRATALAIDPAYAAVGTQLTGIAADTQRVTLAGFRITDPNGTIIAGPRDIGLSLAHIPEVGRAMLGYYAPTMRLRSLNRPPPLIYELARGTQLRVFVALPVVRDGRVAGVIYASRTPDNVLRNLYQERGKVALAAAMVMAATAAIGFVFLRGVAGPIRELARRSRRLESGDRSALAPLAHHGTREIADLAESQRAMAEALFRRTDHMRTFAAHVTHELKSPLTAIQGAAEILLEDAGKMTRDNRGRFIRNILSESQRMTRLVGRLRELAQAETPELSGSTRLGAVVPDLARRFPALRLITAGDTRRPLPLTRENLLIVLGHLVENSAESGAGQVMFTLEGKDEPALLVEDDGTGISANNRAKIFDAFFTTRRERGGTGMGLGIVQALLRGHGGDIALIEADKGAAFRITLPSRH
jgi:signal transduction histidine kinase